MSTNNKVYLVTGVTGGIGGATAAWLAKQGGKLILSGRDQAKLDDAAKVIAKDAAKDTQIKTVAMDVTDETSVIAGMDKAFAAFGKVDCLINIPGMSIPGKIAETSLENYYKMIDVNVTSVFLTAKHYVPRVDPAVGGQIINISSVAGKAANPNAPIYCTAKAAMNMLSAGLALQLKANNIRVSIVSPGATSTTGFWGDRPVPHDKFLKVEEVALVVGFVATLPSSIVLHDVVVEPWEFYRSK
jgi:NADP-dependent 3-hydroxy acid dehydrogenase YdfG